MLLYRRFMPLVEVISASKSYPHPREAYMRQLIAATPELPAGAA
jgi:hypothetical protein